MVMCSRRHQSCSALAVLCLLAAGAHDAKAELGAPTPTVQAMAANATWLAYTPPPEHPGIVCMVDSGVDPNSDTEAAVVGGQALAPETETNDEIARLEPKAQPGNHPNGHGTLMAMMMAAPINGWGMVGIAPTSVRVYNMKALPKGQTTFPFDYYSVAIEECQQDQRTLYPAMNVINLSLGGVVTPGKSELAGLENYVAAARREGLVIVAAAGNEGGPVLYPAAYSPIVAVGAGDAGSSPGALCPFASREEGLDVIAPGCDGQTNGLEGAFEDDGSPAVGSGSSQASAIASAVLASMRAYSPQLTATQAEGCLISTAKDLSIDVAAAFEACGLAQVVKEGQTAEQAALAGVGQATSSNSSQTISLGACAVLTDCTQASPPSSGASGSPGVASGFESKTRCPRPDVLGVSSRGGQFTLRVRGRPSGCRLQARLRASHDHGWIMTHSVPSAKLRLPGQSLVHLQARYASGVTSRTSSQWVTVHSRSDGF